MRHLVRELRDNRAFGWIVRVADRIWWWRTIRRSMLVDTGFYAAQLGLRSIPADLAILHYVSRGFRRGLSVNPLFDEVTAGGHLPEVFRVPAMYAYLLSDRTTVPIHPLWDAPAFARSVNSDSGALEYVWAHPETEIVLQSGFSERRVSVAELREIGRRDIKLWRRPDRADSDYSSGQPHATTLLRVVQKRDRRYGLKLAQAARFAGRDDVSVVLAVVSPDASQWSIARLLSTFTSVRVLGYRADAAWESMVRRALADHPSDVFVVLDARAEFDDADVDALLASAQGGRAASPVQRSMEGSIATAGAAWIVGHARPYRLLEEHPVEDLAAWGEDEVSVPMLTGRTLAIPTAALHNAIQRAAAGGDSAEAWTDAARREGVQSVVLPRVSVVLEEPEYAFRRAGRDQLAQPLSPRSDEPRVRELLAACSFEIEAWTGPPTSRPTPRLRWTPPAPDAQRWAIKICAPPGRAGAVWGDTHFALGLARALRRQGHHVVIDAFGASRRRSAYLDSVSVVIRGPYAIDPPDTGVRIEWIISHPDEIDAREIGRFDHVFAASRRWSAQASRRFGTQIEPLLECTDVDQFHPRGLPRGNDIVFVGTARGVARPSVVAPLAAGVPVKVYGPDWRPFIPVSAVVALTIPNTELPARYETASIVLNDQWPAMREHGFIAMRPFDAVAVGGRVISEDVDEIEELFRGAVVAYRDAEHLVELLRTDPATIFPSEQELHEISAYVREHHSFDARARALMAAVTRSDPRSS